MEQTLSRYPEVRRRSLFQWAAEEAEVRKKAAFGGGRRKVHGSFQKFVLLTNNFCNTSPLCRCKGLAEAMHSFLLAVRDAHGVVTRPLLTAYATTLAPDVQKNFVAIAENRRDRFFTRWRMLLSTGAFQVCVSGVD